MALKVSITQERFDELVKDLLQTIELNEVKGTTDTRAGGLSFRTVNYHVHEFVSKVKASSNG